MTFSLVTFREGTGAAGAAGPSARDLRADSRADLRAGSRVRLRAESRVGLRLPSGSVVEPDGLRRWTSMLDLLEDWPAATSFLDGLDPEELAHLTPVTSAELLAPIRWPRKVMCAGVNYRKHVAEMGGSVPDGDWQPYFFLKPPSTAVTGPGDPIVIRDADNARYDWEIELAVIVGRPGRDIAAAEARQYIAGYCVANDVTARGYHRRPSAPSEPFTYDWFAAKGTDSSLPLGPGITPAKFISDPQNLRLRLWHNGELQQDETTADMICPVDELVAAASKVVTLEPGDVIATGTPSGVGVARGIALKHNDIVTAAIEGLGEISNRVIDAERSEP